jgi:hypothetical protein
MKHGVAMGARTAFRDTAEHAAAIDLVRGCELPFGGFPKSGVSDWYRASSRILLSVVHDFERVARRCHSLPSSAVWFRSAMVHSLTHSVDMQLIRTSVNEGAKETVFWFIRDGAVVLYGAFLVPKKRSLDVFERLLTSPDPDTLDAFRLATENSIGSRFDICAGAL